MRRVPLLAAVAVLVAACGGSSTGAHAVTAAEANQLALMRFVGYEGTGQHFTANLTTAQGTVSFDGYLDYRQHVGYAEASTVDDAVTLEWNTTTLLDWAGTAGTSTPPATLPSGTPDQRPLAPKTNTSDALLDFVVQLGQDRPDNAQLITQDGARWLRSATIGSTPVDVMTGPAPQGGTADAAAAVTYWVDKGNHLLRVDAAFGSGAPTEIDLDGAFRAVPKAPQLG